MRILKTRALRRAGFGHAIGRQPGARSRRRARYTSGATAELERDHHVRVLRRRSPWGSPSGRPDTKTAKDFYAAGGGITAFRTAWRLPATTCRRRRSSAFPTLVYVNGYDGLIYLGRLAGRLAGHLVPDCRTPAQPGQLHLRRRRRRSACPGPVRTLAAVGSLVVVFFYLIAQMVGAGQLVQTLLFEHRLPYAVMMVGALMIIYVTFGGMVATTWVQIIKAGLLLAAPPSWRWA